MKHIIALSILLSMLFSCAEDKATQEKQKTKSTSFTTYQMSEMAALMEKMHQEHQNVKQNIQNGEALGDFPEYYLDIHFAKFTDASDNDDVFKEWAKLYIETEKQLYASEIHQQKTLYNASVQVCLSCHQKKCGGPIPRIRKLLIK